MKKSEAGALSGPHAAHTRTTLVFTAVLAGLICVNLVYFLSTHTRIMQQLHANRLGALPSLYVLHCMTCWACTVQQQQRQ